MRNIKILVTLASPCFLLACAPKYDEKVMSAVTPVTDDIACAHYRYDVFQSLKQYVMDEKKIPEYSQFSYHMQERIQEQVRLGKLKANEAGRLQEEVDKLLKVLLEEMSSQTSSPETFISLLSAVDVGERTTHFKVYLQDKVNNQVQRIQALAEESATSCVTPAPEEPGSLETPSTPETTEAPVDSVEAPPVIKEPVPPAVWGTRLAIATAYQSCNALAQPPLTAASPDVKGIEIYGTHPDGVGSKRRIASLSDLQNSHHYIKYEKSYPASCFNVRQNPLIYDYGGKPYATTSSSSPLDFFRNNGDGTSVLGIDCSGFVFSSYATAGLKLSSSRPLRASDAWSWGSSSYVEPQKNGLSCLQKISLTAQKSLAAGDIIAVVGHVFIVDKIGPDPLGIQNARTVNDCSALKSDGFDFVIHQSSNSKNGIGINSYVASDYMKIAPKFKVGLEKYAYYACLAKFNKKTYTPSLGTLSVVRHKGTPACQAPRVRLAREECVSQCSVN